MVSLPDPSALVGTELVGRYKILSVLGEGGMSIVYVGYHNLMHRDVAIKVLQPNYQRHEPTKKRFLQEAQAASRLNHPNLITVYDFGIADDGLHYLVMNLIEGTSLAEILEEAVLLPPKRAIDIFVQVCEGLSHAHEQGIIHRDLKPENIMILAGKDGAETVRVVDFGVAKMLPRKGKPVERLTQSGEVFGSVLYLSPEQCMAKAVDARSDVYALGCVMYEVIAGLPPFMGETVNQTMEMHVKEPVKPPHLISPEELIVPTELSNIIVKALAKDPGQRHNNMDELKRELLHFAATLKDAPPASAVSAASATPSPENKEKAGPNKNILIAVVSILLLGLISFVVMQVSQTGSKSGSAETSTTTAAPTSTDTATTSTNTAGASSSATESPASNTDVSIANKSEPQILKEASAYDRTDKRTVDKLSKLAMMCHKEGKCDTAEKLLMRSVQIAKDVFGPDSEQTLARESDLATFYMSLGDYDKAEPILKSVMEAGKKSPEGKSAAAEKSKETYAQLMKETGRKDATAK